MWKKIAVIGGTAAIIGGAGTAAFASSATATSTPSPSSTSAASDSAAAVPNPEAGRRTRADRIRQAVHATWVTQNKRTKAFTTHDAIRGLVTAVSPTSITVRAADSTTQTYLVTARTKVFTRAARTEASKTPASKTAAPKTATRTALPRTAVSIADVKTGDSVLVAGTGTTTLSAVRVVDVRK
jgi:hypothetical protein